MKIKKYLLITPVILLSNISSSYVIDNDYYTRSVTNSRAFFNVNSSFNWNVKDCSGLADAQAVYCTGDDSIRVGTSFLQNIEDTYEYNRENNYLAESIIAHEHAHAYQQYYLGGYQGQPDHELMADCYAGAYMETQRRYRNYNVNLYNVAITNARATGDAEHGSPLERWNATLNGATFGGSNYNNPSLCTNYFWLYFGF